jgi:hypothetical protein
MTLPNETIATGAQPRCSDCARMPRVDVYRSGAGYYVLPLWALLARVGLLPHPRGRSGGATLRALRARLGLRLVPLVGSQVVA